MRVGVWAHRVYFRSPAVRADQTKSPHDLVAANVAPTASRISSGIYALDHHGQEPLDAFPDAGILGFPITRDVQAFDLRISAQPGNNV